MMYENDDQYSAFERMIMKRLSRSKKTSWML